MPLRTRSECTTSWYARCAGAAPASARTAPHVPDQRACPRGGRHSLLRERFRAPGRAPAAAERVAAAPRQLLSGEAAGALARLVQVAWVPHAGGAGAPRDARRGVWARDTRSSTVPVPRTWARKIPPLATAIISHWHGCRPWHAVAPPCACPLHSRVKLSAVLADAAARA